MGPLDSVKTRVELMERRLDELEARANEEQPGGNDGLRHLRLAKTFNNGSYPSDPATVYPIIFIDGDYSPSPGNRSLTSTNHSATQQGIAYSLGGDSVYLESGTTVTVFRQGGRYWILPPAIASTASMQIVRVEDGEASSCGAVNDNSDCVWSGKIVTLNIGGADVCGDSVWVDGDPVWIKQINKCSVSSTLSNGERYIGRKVGQWNFSGDIRDLYEIQSSQSTTSSYEELVLHDFKTYTWSDSATTFDKYMLKGGNENCVIAFDESYGTSSISHDPSETTLFTGGNITALADGIYLFQVCIKFRLARTTAAAASPPTDREPFQLLAYLDKTPGGNRPAVGSLLFTFNDPTWSAGATGYQVWASGNTLSADGIAYVAMDVDDQVALIVQIVDVQVTDYGVRLDDVYIRVRRVGDIAVNAPG